MPCNSFPNYVDETPGVKHYCTCGEYGNKPYCDGSHDHLNTGKSPKEFNVAQARRMATCDCGKTGNSPLCDGTHSKQ